MLGTRNVRAEGTHGVHQITYGALVHARLAGNSEFTAADAQGGSQGTHGRAGVTEE